jgi:energy-coupling factor transporter ATP-binding protein EcfA2
VATHLALAIAAQQNILIAGGTGTGKTTLLNALAARISDEDRIIVIEETAEIHLDTPNILRFEARRAQAPLGQEQPLPPVTIADLVRASLRHRPDRIIVGEVRGAEAFDLLQALNTGHLGSLSTIHANSAEQALTRLAHCVLTANVGLPHRSVREAIAFAVHLVVHIARINGRISRFDTLVHEFEGDVAFARTVARAAFIAPDPVRAASEFVRDYRSVVRQLTAQALEPSIARSIARIASLGGDPLKTAFALVQKFRDVEHVVKRTHPHVARSVALAACRATDPIAAARAYVANYDRIVELIGRVDPPRARRVATQAFRTHDPIGWATRFHRQLTTSQR